MGIEDFGYFGWRIAEPDKDRVKSLAEGLNVPEMVARILVNRGVDTASKAQSFLNPHLDQLHDFFLLPDMEKGAGRIASAIREGEKIMVHGDYDVDGVTGAAVLVRTLTLLGADVIYKIPHRKTDGYDIKPPAVEWAYREGASLIVTCDCGTSAMEAAERAKQLEIDLVVTDHHEPAATLPDVYAIINPKRKDFSYPFADLAGVGVALKTAQCVAHYMGREPDSVLNAYLDLAALGTVADVVPLVDENRAIVSHGLNAISKSKKIGLRTALEHIGCNNRYIDPHFIGFRLAPRLNAVGRLDDATISLKLLLTREEEEAIQIVELMEQLNYERMTIQREMVREAAALAKQKDSDNLYVLVLIKEDWNAGIVGIVASSLSEMLCMPIILLAADQKNGIYSGSGRSFGGFHLKDALDACADTLLSYGGHAGAVGLSLHADMLEVFEARINEYAKVRVPEMPAPVVDIDAYLTIDQIDINVAKLISKKLQPFGEGNPEPVFATSDMIITHAQSVGADGSHLRLFFEGVDDRPLECIAFNWGKHISHFEPGSIVDVCYNLQINTFRRNEELQMSLVDLRKSGNILS